MNRLPAFHRTAGAVLLVLAAMAGPAQVLAQPRIDANRGQEGPSRPDVQPPRAEPPRVEERRSDDRRSDERRGDDRRGVDRRDDRRDDRRFEGPRAGVPRPVVEPGRGWPEPSRGFDTPRWHDGAHGLNRDYPRPGWVVRQPPPRAGVVYWGGVNYRFWDGVWYSPGPSGFVVVRPPYGVVIADRPESYSLVTIGGIGYLYANGVYYRDYVGGGYEVVPPPVDGSNGAAFTVTTAPQPRAYVYPARGQSAERQATDEYECHAWALSQTGYDPTAVATGQRTGSDPAQRDNYQRARIACLEGRGYTVR